MHFKQHFVEASNLLINVFRLQFQRINTSYPNTFVEFFLSLILLTKLDPVKYQCVK